MRSRIWLIIWLINIKNLILNPEIVLSPNILGYSLAGYGILTSAIVLGIRFQLLIALLFKRALPAVNISLL
jgi:hypothetical protein